LAALIEDQTRAPGLLATDATGIPVLDPHARDGIRTGAMWCWTNARWVLPRSPVDVRSRRLRDGFPSGGARPRRPREGGSEG
ncbi:MAG TPA: hypothetical protein VF420_13745, partial [Casimicrobiaceae bacterium]